MRAWIGPRSWLLLLPAGLGLFPLGSLASRPAPPPLRGAARPRPAVSPIRDIALVDLTGQPRSLREFGPDILVLVFLQTACPVANSYAERLSGLDRRWRPRGVRLVGINASPDEAPADMLRHVEEYRLSFPVFRDENQHLARRLEARVTPEAFVVDAAGAVRYGGRIDDGAVPHTRQRVKPRSNDLEEAVAALLAGKQVRVPRTWAVGCAITTPAPRAQPAAVTYYRDVQPILQERCQSCHRPGQAAPFSLLTYPEARGRADDIRQITGARQMPPWLAEPGHGEFEGVRRLPEVEIATLAAWAGAGAPAGDPQGARAPRQWPDGWTLGAPDLILSLAEAYSIPASGEDRFRAFVLPTGLKEDREVVGVEFRPGSARVVHHVLGFADSTGRARELDRLDSGPGYGSGPGGVGIPDAALLGLWTPGNAPSVLPPGMGRPLKAGSDVVLQIHYHPTGKLETDRTTVGLYFARKPVTQLVRTVVVGADYTRIPAGATRHQVHTHYTLRLDVRLLSIMPHMHLLGKEMRVTAILPNGAVKDLVWIKRWDYRWQDAYRFKEPLALPKGTRLDLIAYFDNSAGNPLNPHRPPQEVLFGELTTQEMASMILEGVTE